MEKKEYSGIPIEEVPLGFGMALAQNEQAIDRFSKLDERQKQRFLFEARHVRSQAEMQRIVDRIGAWE